MFQAILNRTGENVAGAAHKASRGSFAIGEAIEDGVDTARCVARQSSHVAEDFIDNVARRLRKKPVEAVLTSLTAGIVVGSAVGWSIKRPSA